MFSLKNILKFDFILLALSLSLVAYSVYAIAGATYTTTEAVWYNTLWFRQLQMALLGFTLLVGVLFVDYQLLVRYSSFLYAAGIIALLLCFSPLGVYNKGAYSWLKFPGLPQFQPAEIVKITTILFLANVLANRQEQWTGALDVLKPLVIGIIPAILLLKQPDLGTAVVFGPITLLMMFIAGMPLTYFLFLFSPALCLMAISHDPFVILLWFGIILTLLLVAVVFRVPWSVWVPCLAIAASAYGVVHFEGEKIWEKLPEHQKNRIVGYMNPDFDPQKTNYNINQSKITLGSGGLDGKGFAGGTQSIYGFIPEFEHDFIFTVIGEQFGFFGTTILLGLFLTLLMRGLDTALDTRSLQGSLVATGVVAMFFSHIFINIGMVTGLLPVTGLPLSFISYGGTFMIANLLCVGLLINIRLRASEELTKDSVFKVQSQMAIPKTFRDDFF